jgi:hypothetical protein
VVNDKDVNERSTNNEETPQPLSLCKVNWDAAV